MSLGTIDIEKSESDSENISSSIIDFTDTEDANSPKVVIEVPEQDVREFQKQLVRFGEDFRWSFSKFRNVIFNTTNYGSLELTSDAADPSEIEENRLILMESLFRKIHPSPQFWAEYSEVMAAFLQLNQWFGLTSQNETIMGQTSEFDQFQFWTLLFKTAQSTSTCCHEAIDTHAMTLFSELIEADTSLDENISSLTCYFGRGVALDVMENNVGPNLSQKLQELKESVGTVDTEEDSITEMSACIMDRLEAITELTKDPDLLELIDACGSVKEHNRKEQSASEELCKKLKNCTLKLESLNRSIPKLNSSIK